MKTFVTSQIVDARWKTNMPKRVRRASVEVASIGVGPGGNLALFDERRTSYTGRCRDWITPLLVDAEARARHLLPGSVLTAHGRLALPFGETLTCTVLVNVKEVDGDEA